MNIGAIIQTRMGSTRLPGKVMIDIDGKPVIRHVWERLAKSRNLDSIIIATTLLEQDDIIVEQAKSYGAGWFRGSEEDVLSRYYHAAEKYNLDVIVRITSDCPLIDPFVIDAMLEFYAQNRYDMVSNAPPDLTQRTFPRGLDAEIFSYAMLKEAYGNASERYQREHVTPYMYEKSARVFIYKNSTDCSKYRWTLDTDEDLAMIKTVYHYLYKGEHNFFFKDIIELLEKYPEIAAINRDVEQKKLKA